MEGSVTEALRNRMYRIQLDNGHETLGYMAGKMKRYRIRINPGDRVRIELSTYDLNRGRIVYRLGESHPETGAREDALVQRGEGPRLHRDRRR